ncbi:uncharacterized protein VTP21DRAFT_654 [Calcarisporiella thermophila]|uniref:uncharacterized protein n=1 Tax=Calcarisporiella thermophila TaxID=911321 RepID=UPI00374285D7
MFNSVLARIPARGTVNVQALRSLHQTHPKLSRFSDLVRKVEKEQGIHSITVSQLHQQLSVTSPPHVIDVRESSEISRGKIPRAIPLPRGILERDVEKHIKAEDESKVVVYCAGGLRSILAAESLIRMGYKNVLSLEGGIDAWRKEGYEIEAGEKQGDA